MNMLITGDLVVMHTCMEADNPANAGKIWTCKSDEFKHHPTHDYTVIMLEGFSGSFATKYLQKVDVSVYIKERELAYREGYKQGRFDELMDDL